MIKKNVFAIICDFISFLVIICVIFDQIFHILMLTNFLYIWDTLTYTVGTLKHCKNHDSMINNEFISF